MDDEAEPLLETAPDLAQAPVDAPIDNLVDAPVDAQVDAPVYALAPTADPEVAATITDRALQLLDSGGPVVAILGVMSVIALAILLIKLWQFRSARLGDRRTPQQVLWLYQSGRVDEALAIARASMNPVAQALFRAMAGLQRGVPEARIREGVARYCGDALETLRGWFRPLEVIASLAPLLGLFGTVLGMIEAFQQLEQAGNQVNPAILSGGIWQALLTTAVGLAVAIPVVAILNWLERQTDRVAHDMESQVSLVFTGDPADDRQERSEHAPDYLRPASATAV